MCSDAQTTEQGRLSQGTLVLASLPDLAGSLGLQEFVGARQSGASPLGVPAPGALRAVLQSALLETFSGRTLRLGSECPAGSVLLFSCRLLL